VLTAVAVIGAITLLYAGFSALAQSDIKRALAYSTMSQVGYMFLALGVGAWSAALFHFVTHAFFKALLFLAAGVVIVALNHEQDMRNMGGLRRHLPLAFWSFLVGAASLSAIPLVTAGFYSKDSILFQVWSSPTGGPWLWLAGVVGATLTALYSFRMVFLVFFGRGKGIIPIESDLNSIKNHRSGLATAWPLVALSIFAVGIGFIELPATLGNLHLFSDFIGQSLPTLTATASIAGAEGSLQIAASAASLCGVLLAYLLVLRRPMLTHRTVAVAVVRFFRAGWAFDWLYEQIFTRPLAFVTRANKDDALNWIYRLVAGAIDILNKRLSATESGRLRWYAAGIGIGAVVLLGIEIVTWY
jgi:NADH-quinone oxidoreductase subunit L